MVWLTDLADGLRKRGLTVVEVDGWKTRGARNIYPPYQQLAFNKASGTLWHHTATNRQRFNDSDAPTLSMCVNGRSDLPGPLCNIVFGRGGVVYVIAAGVGNHAGRGWGFPGVPEDEGNFYLIGIEMESSGVAPWDWTADQLRVAPYLGAALMDMYGYTLNLAHYEYSKEGKIDPAGWPGGMDGLRAQITAVSGSAAIQPGPPDSPQIVIDKPKPKEWDELASKDEVKAALREVIGEADTRKKFGESVWHWATRAWNGNVSMEARLTGLDAAVNDPKNTRMRDALRGLDVKGSDVSAREIAAAIPQGLAEQVANELGKRLNK